MAPTEANTTDNPQQPWCSITTRCLTFWRPWCWPPTCYYGGKGEGLAAAPCPRPCPHIPRYQGHALLTLTMPPCSWFCPYNAKILVPPMTSGLVTGMVTGQYCLWAMW